MIQIGSEVKRQSFMSSLEQGYVFRIKGNDPFKSDIYHVFIVLNYDPSNDKMLLLVNGTSKVEKALLRMQKNPNIENDTMVYFQAGSYAFFSKDTVVDCNTVMEVDIRRLDFSGDKIQAIHSDSLRSEDISRIVNGVLKSRSVSESMKARVRQHI